MPWLYITIAGLLEIAWAIGLKQSNGFTRPLIVVPTLICMVASFYFLALGLRTIPVGTGYAVWTGIGAVGTAILGIAIFGEPASWPRLLCLLLIICGIFGLRFLSGPASEPPGATARAPAAPTSGA